MSKGSVSNFNKEAHKQELMDSFRLYRLGEEKAFIVPESYMRMRVVVNVGGKGHWLHSLSNGMVTLYGADRKRGKEAMDKMGVLPDYKGVLCHDHWKPYYRYTDCSHALCNAHHLRELLFAYEQDGQKWADLMKKCLLDLKDRVKDSKEGFLSSGDMDDGLVKYQKILKEGGKECPDSPKIEGKRGRQKKSKSRNLLERLQKYEEDVLRFARVSFVPFTNNIAEGDVRVAKMYESVSKCFRTLKGAKRFCDLRSYLVTCMRYGMDATDALMCLFTGETPFFMKE